MLSYAQGPAPVMFAALLGLAIFGCNGDGDGDGTTASTTDETVGTDSMSSTVGVSTTSVSEPTTSSDPTTSASDSTTTTDATTTSTTTTDATTTSTTTTGDTSTSTSDGDSTSTGDTMGETESTTLMTTTGGECMERGEELCGDLCVDTQFDDDHCGKCFNPCNRDEGESCSEGECTVVIPPYGAPMPEPLWI